MSSSLKRGARDRKPSTFRNSLAGAAGVLLLAPAIAGAQGGTITGGGVGTGPVGTVSVRARGVPAANSCLRLSSTPSRLNSSPEGMTMVKMMAELDAINQRANMRQDTLPQETRKQIFFLRSAVDSVVRVYTGTGEMVMAGGRMEMTPRIVQDKRAEPSEAERMMVSMRLRELQPQVSELARAHDQTVVGTLNIRLNTLGYVGLTASAGTFPMDIDPNKPFAYCEYPRVESVDPGSPADKAGLAAGDTLVAYNNRDLRAFDVNYQDIMIPGKPLIIRYRRDGQVKNAAVTVAPRPPEIRRFVSKPMGACTEAEARAGCQSQTVVVRGLPYPQSSGGVMVTTRDVLPVLMSDGNGGGILVGASVRAIDDQLAQNLGLEAGVLVFQVPANNPAYDSGLRGGDLIISVNGTVVRDLNAMDRALRVKQSERLAELQVTNKQAGVRKVTLRW